MQKITILRPLSGQQVSFYNKALIIQEDNGDTYLQSYDTIICKVTSDNKIVKLWEGQSNTTSRHIKAFLQQFTNININDYKKLEVSTND